MAVPFHPVVMKSVIVGSGVLFIAACAVSLAEPTPSVMTLETPLFDVVSREAAAGDPKSQNLLGYLLFFGEHAPLDRKAAVGWLMRSADAGYPQAQVNMALLHALGVGVPRDEESARRFLGEARANPSAHGTWRFASLETLVQSACRRPVDREPGDALFGRFCAGCHGWDGIATYRGSPSFALGERLEKSDDELLGSIRDGLGTMPAWSDKLPEPWLRETVDVVRRLERDFQGGILRQLRDPPDGFFRFGPMASDWAATPHRASTAYGSGIPKDPELCPTVPFVATGETMISALSAAAAAALSIAGGLYQTEESQVLPDSLPPGVTGAMVKLGQEVFEGRGLCYTCHGAEAGGLIGPTLTDPAWWYGEGTYLAIVRQILVGVPVAQSTVGVPMPAMGGGDISEADVLAVASFVWRVSHPDVDSLPAGVSDAMISRGDEVFHGAGRCFTCHGDDASGALGPDLTDDQWLHAKGSYLTILQQVLVGVSSGRSRTGIEMPPRGGAGLSDAEVQAVAAYVWVLSRAAP